MTGKEFKAAVLARVTELMNGEVTKEELKKAAGRFERWMNAAYGYGGSDGWKEYEGEGGLDGAVGNVTSYLAEIRKGVNRVTENGKQFGIHGTGGYGRSE